MSLVHIMNDPTIWIAGLALAVAAINTAFQILSQRKHAKKAEFDSLCSRVVDVESSRKECEAKLKECEKARTGFASKRLELEKDKFALLLENRDLIKQVETT